MQSTSVNDDRPSVFALSVVFGGSIGLTIGDALGGTGAGFFIGSATVFLLLGGPVIYAHLVERSDLQVLIAHPIQERIVASTAISELIVQEQKVDHLHEKLAELRDLLSEIEKEEAAEKNTRVAAYLHAATSALQTVIQHIRMFR